MRYGFAIIVALVFCGKAKAEEALNTYGQIAIIDSAEEAVKSRLKDPDSAEFDKVFYHHSAKFHHVVCGQVNAKNAFGGYNGYQGFISNGSPNVTFLQNDMASFKEFRKSWKQLCID